MKKPCFDLDCLFKRKLEITTYIFAVFLVLTVSVSIVNIIGNILTNYPFIANIKWLFAITLSCIGFLLIYKKVFVETFKTITFLTIHFVVVWPSWFMGGGDNSITMLYMFLLAIESLLIFEKMFLKWTMVGINMISLVICVVIVYQFPHLIDTTHPAQNVFMDTLIQVCIIFIVTAVSVNIYIASYRKQHLLLNEAVANLEIAATVDVVAHVYNRRKILEELAQARARFEDKALYVLMADIDYFKGINDQYGHQMGDAAIGHLATHLCAITGYQSVGRYGGDEFIAFFADIDEATLQGILKKIIKVPPLAGIPLTISAGLAEALPGQSDIDAIHAADELLLQAKLDGRNRILMYNGTVIAPSNQ